MSAPGDDAAVAEYLFGLKPRGTKYGIDRMRPFAAALGHPERAVPVIHVAGTNGKGSVAAMIEAILRAAGWRVGLYTSPHLVNVGERVQVDRVPMSASELAAHVHELDLVADRVVAEASAEDRPSFFEFMTAMAFLQFARKRCDIAVVEVGLGGEFDATNIVTPEVSVITSIGLDHCEWLGDTIEQIARAKAGIIKAGRPVVLGRVPEEAERVIRESASLRGAPLTTVTEIFGNDVERYPTTSLEGVYQRWNGATATLAVRALASRWNIAERHISDGLAATRWAGRWERVRVGRRTLVLDAAHNPEGAEVLEANLARLAAELGRAPVVVVGALGTARARPLLDAVCRHAKVVHLVVPQEPRASSFAELEAALPVSRCCGAVRDTVRRIFPGGDHIDLGEPDDVVVVTGSIYLLGEVLTQLRRSP